MEDIPKPALSIDEENRDQWLEKTQLRLKDYVVLAPSAEFGPSKQWSPEKYARLADLIVQQGLQVCIIGATKDMALSQNIVRLACNGQAVNDLTGKTNLGDVIDLMSGARAVISNDSGLMHVAAAAQTFVIAIYGSTSPEYTPPLSVNSGKNKIFWESLECSPCFQRSCRFGHYHCLEQIEVEDVLETIVEIC